MKVLEQKVNHGKETTEAQTNTSKLEGSKDVYFCGECDYLADCIHDFNDHTHSSDGLENHDKSLFNCNFCDESFETLQEVMKHNKMIHTSSVQHCKHFLEDICYFGDNCWFLHSESFRNSEPSFKCNSCEDKFRTQKSLREHMKSMHIQFVSKCKNEDECKFGTRKCWFLHQEDIEIAYQNAKDDMHNDNNIYDMECNEK